MVIRPDQDTRSGTEQSVHIHFCEADRSPAAEDAAAVAALGLAVTLSSLDEAAPAGPALPVALMYLSARVAQDHARVWRARIEQARDAHVSLVVIALDDTPPPVRLTSAPLQRHSLSRAEYLRRLLADVLESLDRTGWVDDTLMQTRLVLDALVVSQAGGQTVIPPDFRGLITVGRSATCQISVASTFASRLHGCFRRSGDHYLYRDMSTNGTILYDGHEEILLHDDERELPAVGELRIGDVTLSFSTQPR